MGGVHHLDVIIVNWSYPKIVIKSTIRSKATDFRRYRICLDLCTSSSNLIQKQQRFGFPNIHIGTPLVGCMGKLAKLVHWTIDLSKKWTHPYISSQSNIDLTSKI